MLLILFLLSFANPGRAQGHLTTNAITTSLEHNQLKAAVAEGFHFNNKAPNSLNAGTHQASPEYVTPREVRFPVTSSFIEGAKLSLYVCDDALTFCQTISLRIDKSGHSVEWTESSVDEKKADSLRPLTKNKTGFFEDHLDQVIELAHAQHQLILADFSARWCPGCVRLESEIFSSTSFQKMTNKVLKVRIDSDRFENSELKKKYGIHGIPTLMLLNPEGEEIARLVDFVPLETLAKFLKDGRKNSQSMAALTAQVNSKNKTAAGLLGLRLYAAEQYSQAIPFLEMVKPEPIELRDAKIRALAESAKKDPATKKEVLEKMNVLLAKESGSTRSLAWRGMILEIIDEKDPMHKVLLDQGLALADGLLAHPERISAALKGDAIGEFVGLEKLLVASERADLVEASGASDEQKQQAFEIVAKTAKSLKISPDRLGPAMRTIVFLVAAKQFADAELIGKELLARNPGNPEIQRRLLRILNEQQKYKEALPLGEASLPQSYGQNEVWVAVQLAKAYVGDGQTSKAKDFIHSYLAKPELGLPSLKKENQELRELLKLAESKKL